jgi:hypothetical protein
MTSVPEATEEYEDEIEQRARGFVAAAFLGKH